MNFHVFHKDGTHVEVVPKSGTAEAARLSQTLHRYKLLIFIDIYVLSTLKWTTYYYY